MKTNKLEWNFKAANCLFEEDFFPVAYPPPSIEALMQRKVLQPLLPILVQKTQVEVSFNLALSPIRFASESAEKHLGPLLNYSLTNLHC